MLSAKGTVIPSFLIFLLEEDSPRLMDGCSLSTPREKTDTRQKILIKYLVGNNLTWVGNPILGGVNKRNNWVINYHNAKEKYTSTRGKSNSPDIEIVHGTSLGRPDTRLTSRSKKKRKRNRYLPTHGNRAIWWDKNIASVRHLYISLTISWSILLVGFAF